MIAKALYYETYHKNKLIILGRSHNGHELKE